MSSPLMNKEYPSQAQRFAVCKSQYKRAKHKKETKDSEISWRDVEKQGFIIE